MPIARESIETALQRALGEFEQADRYLLEKDVGERTVAARIAMYLQRELPNWCVDVEYNRAAAAPKRLNLPEEYADYRDENGDSLVVPDIIVHRRGPQGPNLLVVELKKTTHSAQRRKRDEVRIRAFQLQLNYQFGCLLVCETRAGHGHRIEPYWQP